MKTAKVSKTKGTIHRLVADVAKLGADHRSTLSALGGLVTKMRQEMASTVEQIRQLLMRGELGRSASEIQAHALRNSQVEIDAIFYLLNQMDPEVFSFAALRAMVQRVQMANLVSGVICGLCRVTAPENRMSLFYRFINAQPVQEPDGPRSESSIEERSVPVPPMQ